MDEAFEVSHEPVRVVQAPSPETRQTMERMGIRKIQGHYVIRAADGTVKDEWTVTEE